MRLIQHSAINIQHFPTGQLQVEEGLYSYGARFYDSALGRFISADTLIPQPRKGVIFVTAGGSRCALDPRLDPVYSYLQGGD